MTAAPPSSDTQARIERVLERDERAFAELVFESEPRLHLFLRVHGASLFRGDYAVEDATQQTLAIAWSRIETFEYRGPGSFHRWLLRVGSRVLSDRRKYVTAKGRHAATSSLLTPRRFDLPASVTSIAERVDRGDRARRAADAIRALPGDDRRLVEWHLLEERSLREIAAKLGVSRNAVWERLQRAMAVVKRRVDGPSERS